MCLALPGQIVTISEDKPDTLRMGCVDFGGVQKEVCLACVPNAIIGDFVMVHAGIAITKVDESEARRVFTYLKEVEFGDAPA